MAKINLKIVVIALLGFFLSGNLNAQSFNTVKTAFSNFIKRMYVSSPFEGVIIIDDYDHQYLVSVVNLDNTKYTNQNVMNRVAQVKAQTQANTFLNGATITMDMVITTKETKDSTNNVKTIVETVENIKQNSVGFTQGLELLNSFDENKNLIFIYLREIKK